MVFRGRAWAFVPNPPGAHALIPLHGQPPRPICCMTDGSRDRSPARGGRARRSGKRLGVGRPAGLPGGTALHLLLRPVSGRLFPVPGLRRRDDGILRRGAAEVEDLDRSILTSDVLLMAKRQKWPELTIDLDYRRQFYLRYSRRLRVGVSRHAKCQGISQPCIREGGKKGSDHVRRRWG